MRRTLGHKTYFHNKHMGKLCKKLLHLKLYITFGQVSYIWFYKNIYMYKMSKSGLQSGPGNQIMIQNLGKVMSKPLSGCR